jgi:hypothetical protein
MLNNMLDKNNPALKSDIKNDQQLTLSSLDQILQQWRRKHLQQHLLLFLPLWLIVLVVFSFCLSLSGLNIVGDVAENEFAIAAVMLFIFGIMTKLVLIKRSKKYHNITLKNLIVHLNSHFESLEQSAQLLLLAQDKLSNLEKLQQSKVLVRLNDILQQSQINNAEITPEFDKRKFILRNVSLFFSLIIFLIFTQFNLIDKALFLLGSADNNIHEIYDKNQNQSEQDKTIVQLLSTNVTVTPPSYSVAEGQPTEFTSQVLDVDTLVGSKVRWQLTISEQSANVFLIFSNGEQHQLIIQTDGTFQVELTLHKSMVYHIAIRDQASEVVEAISDVFRINLTPDNAPKIRFINPKSTITEYGKNTVPALYAEVQISDDFALTDIHIKASIAKGSGEGIKFRDENFTFDSHTMVNAKQHYYKKWSIEELAMEPGDELYFSIVATDNREPEHQQTRSETKIIRWLDEEQTGINADGILIDFMPEYFKSQRQIIIETLVLIEDKFDLDRKSFNQKSELLGVAQSALKEKYGQYLGDEVEREDNEATESDDSHHDTEHIKPKIHIHDEQGGSANAVISANKTVNPSGNSGHEHENHATKNNSQGSARMELINKYGHNHEDSDVGVMTSQDPRALMKKSLANMWQAELHLMLSEPELALPFEQQALKLLNLARKAERIYVKRLGFEPPPVTEQRRYQGEQSDILANSVQISRFKPEQLSDQTLVVFRQFLQLLNNVNQQLVVVSKRPKTVILQNTSYVENENESELTKNVPLSVNELALVKQAKLAIEELIDDRPALVDVLVVIEQILLEQRLNLSQCEQCINLLAGKIAQLLPSPTSSPNRKIQDFENQQPLVEQYSQFLEANL